jgi:nitric oxide dioxygenase
MLAIGETLGGAVTLEIGAAWSEAVATLADVLIGVEEDLAAELAARPGGWTGERDFTLTAKEVVAADTLRFTFQPLVTESGFGFTPGRYLTIRIPGLGVAPRHYTVTSKPGDPFLQCTTRLVANGMVSGYMHGADTFPVGTKVLFGVPCGVFTPPAVPNPCGSVLVSAGIGATPMYALFNGLGPANVKADWCVNPTADRALFLSEFQESGVPTTSLLSQDFPQAEAGGHRAGLLGEARKLVEATSKDCDFFLCGPNPFMASFRCALARCGVTEDRVKMEVFGTGTPGSGYPFPHNK